MKSESPKLVLERAIKQLGGQSATAEALTKATKKKFRQSTVRGWLFDTDNGVPAEICPFLEKLTEIPRAKFRPDVYGSV